MNDWVGILFRIGKALLLGAVMYFSLRALNFSVDASFAFSLVPAILGSLNIMTTTAFTLTGIVLIVACGSMLLKETNFKVNPEDATKFIQSFSNEKKPAANDMDKKSDENRKSPENAVSK